MLSKEESIEKEFDGEVFSLVSTEEIDGVKIYKFSRVFKGTIYCTLEDGDYKKIDREANKELSDKIKETFENYEMDIIL